jgi:hypothetical protein
MNPLDATGDAFVDELCLAWDQAAAAGRILHTSETLTVRTVPAGSQTLKLLYNSCRDAYDRRLREQGETRALPALPQTQDPELLRTAEGFVVRGNRFACVRYQSLLAPAEPLDDMTPAFIAASLAFAQRHPALTLMYNALGAGKTVASQFWLLSVSPYENLRQLLHRAQPRGIADGGVPVSVAHEPCYAITFDVQTRPDAAAALLHALASSMGKRQFNIFLHEHQAVFIPREPIEVPAGFEHHRFGGLEMIGCFVMKSADALNAADADHLSAGIRQISYSRPRQERLEAWLVASPASASC